MLGALISFLYREILVPSTLGLFVFLNLIQKGQVGEVGRKRQYITTVERQGGGRKAQWLRGQALVPDCLG